MEPLPGGGTPPIPGRTPIACMNCANAKAGCDKGVPCGRCIEKNLACEARFARRSYKAPLRAPQASAAFSIAAVQSSPPQQTQAPGGINAMFMDADQPGVETKENISPTAIEVAITSLHVAEDSPKKASPHPSQMSPDGLPSPPLNDFTYMGNGFAPQDHAYQDLMLWPDFSMNPDAYPNPIPLGRADFSIPVFPGLGDIPSPEHLTASSSSRAPTRTPGSSIMSAGDLGNVLQTAELAMVAPTDNSIPEFEVMIVAEGAWNLARCNPPPAGNCPRTAIVHLESLERKSRQDETWAALEKYLERVDWGPSDLTTIAPLTSRTRDKILAITQSFLHKALDVHRKSLHSSRETSPSDFNFLVLPSVKILEALLRSYIRSLSGYYALVAAGCVDPNEMLQDSPASTLLVLLTIAQGAATIPIAEARCLSAGLTETCRISLFDIVEKDVELSTDPTTLRCALLFIVLGAWSGDKWLMDIAMRQRGMYMSVSAGFRISAPSCFV